MIDTAASPFVRHRRLLDSYRRWVDDGGDDVTYCDKRFFWHHVPKSVAFRYTEDPSLVETAKKLDKEGNSRSSLWYAPDLKFNPVRFICVAEQMRRQKKKYKKFSPLNG